MSQDPIWTRRAKPFTRAAVVACLGIALVGCPAQPSDAPPDGQSADLAAGNSDGGSVDLAGGVTPLFCSADGWCWRNPLPQGNPLNAVYVTAPDRILAAGDRGNVLRYENSVFSMQATGVS